MMMIHIKNVTLMSFARGGKLEFTDDAAIIVKGNRIEYAGPVSRLPVDAEFDEVIDGGGCLAMPALANAHSHSAMNLLRGLGSDLNLHDWLHDKIFPAEARMTAEDAYVGASLAFREMLSFGISACCDMYFHSDSILEAARDTGIRIAMVNPVVGADGGDTSQLDGIYALHKKWHGAANDRIRIMTGLHAEYTSVPELVTKVSAQARELNARVHVHCAETASETLGCVSRYGKSPVKYFADLGLFDNPTVAAHCVHVSDDDIDILADKGVYAAHNPVSNLKLASGVSPVHKMLRRGVNVCLGTDGAASHNALNLWEEIRLMSILHKGVSGDPTVVSPYDTIRAATVSGFNAMGFDGAGAIESGNLADIILIDRSSLHHQPIIDSAGDLVYSTQGSDVMLTMVDGIVRYERSNPLTDKTLTDKARAAAARMSDGLL
ncbi:5-methylthioadenosine/S-adenosylhomocysteine deaminase [Clostridia bacterium]|nr:5-methylthioadenosine/S-adenosylhomocysteine deaminase [Clostridia bacterium]